ncbi:DUF1326 domain-containing protein [Georgenia sp. SYP-B2076]|uniref:DUF1326 domain-containing protein n=1 Tax=Georgenia sp. SYP-B2076 TaxID=2495881 RepID=UPI000F8CBBDE|nr:DUF1326 domain-containing protein [Georgenia sp. SYP-B2076]
MAEVPGWALTGDWFDVCSCDVPCPCTFAQPPSRNRCEGVLAWHVREGHYGDVALDGLNLIAVSAFEGNIWAGAKCAMGMYVDERADEAQRDAMLTIFGGRAGGWPAGFAELIGDMRGLEYASVRVEVAEDLSRWRAEVPGHVTAEAEALTGPTAAPGARVQLFNAPGAEVGPGGPATWGVGTAARVDAPAFSFAFEWGGRSSKHFPFRWSGPDA